MTLAKDKVTFMRKSYSFEIITSTVRYLSIRLKKVNNVPKELSQETNLCIIYNVTDSLLFLKNEGNYSRYHISTIIMCRAFFCIFKYIFDIQGVLSGIRSVQSMLETTYRRII